MWDLLMSQLNHLEENFTNNLTNSLIGIGQEINVLRFAFSIYIPNIYIYIYTIKIILTFVIIVIKSKYVRDKKNFKIIFSCTVEITLMQEDLYYPHPFVQDILWSCLNIVAEPLLIQWPMSKLRQEALKIVMQHICYEDENTHYVCLGPISKVFLFLFFLFFLRMGYTYLNVKGNHN